jgi:hypothetical protein
MSNLAIVFLELPPPNPTPNHVSVDELAIFKGREHKAPPPVPEPHKGPLIQPPKQPQMPPRSPIQQPNQNHQPNKQHPPNVIPMSPLPKNNNPPSKDNKPKSSRPDHEAQCTQQEISCNFVREAAYQMQNDDDECLKLATSFDAEGKIHFEPIAQDNENVIYGLTTDGLTASAWCNDVGWALRKIYINCRRGNKCYGGKFV